MTDNFITKQCFEDVVLSCHAAVLLIKATRDFTPEQEVCLSKCGSDVCEDFFSQNGSWIMNKHNYTFGDMLTNLPAMNRIMHIRGDAAGPDVPKGHKKQCNIWDKGNDTPPDGPDMKAFPTDEDLYAAWEEGLQQARQLCHDIGKTLFMDRFLWFL